MQYPSFVLSDDTISFQAPTDKEYHVNAARFSTMWNLIIMSFREEDLIDNREMDLLLVPYFQDSDLGIFQWPPFLLDSKVFHNHSLISLTPVFMDQSLFFYLWIVDSNSFGYGGK